MDRRHREELKLLVSEERIRALEKKQSKTGRAGFGRGARSDPALPVGLVRTAEWRTTVRETRSAEPLPMQVVETIGYRYELRRGDALMGTGHITRSQALEVGERIVIGGMQGIVRKIDLPLGDSDRGLTVQLLRGKARQG